MQEEQIREFFEGAKKLLNENRLDKKELDNFFSNLRFRLDIFQENKKQTDVYLASDFNVFDYIYPDENRLSDIIAHLLDPKGKHAQGDVFLKEFLIVISKKVNDATYENLALHNLRVIREDPTSYIPEFQRRIDITIDFNGRFGIGIENKPWAGPRPKQLERYKQHLDKKYIGRFILFYLSPNGSLPPRESLDPDEREALRKQKKFEILSYPIEFKNWLESCYKECRAERVRWFLKDFIDYVEEKFKQSLMEQEGGEEDGE